MNEILRKILQTHRPNGCVEHNLAFMQNLLTELAIGFDTDDAGNVLVTQGQSQSCFTSHYDTVADIQLKHTLNELIIEQQWVSVKGRGILGADCGAGMYLMIRMIQTGIPGHYVFFAEEERGRIGSRSYQMPTHIKRCISFDRKGEKSLITHQSGDQGLSPAFIDYFCQQFPLFFVPDPTGSFTDSYSFFDQVPECTNLSVGYQNAHTYDEKLNLAFLEKMIEACCQFDWELLPTDSVLKKSRISV